MRRRTSNLLLMLVCPFILAAATLASYELLPRRIADPLSLLIWLAAGVGSSAAAHKLPAEDAARPAAGIAGFLYGAAVFIVTSSAVDLSRHGIW